MELKKVAPENLIGRCSWCGRSMPAGLPVFAIGGKRRDGVDFPEPSGQWIEFALNSEQRRLPALLPAANSQAAREGYDVMFIACTAQCGNEMKLALEKEINQGGTVLGGVKSLGS
jgi:hypothetical protein